MSNIPSSPSYIQIEGTRFRSAVSEGVAQTIGGSINFLLDQNTSNTAAIATLNSEVAALQVISSSLFTYQSASCGAASGTAATILFAGFNQAYSGRRVHLSIQGDGANQISYIGWQKGDGNPSAVALQFLKDGVVLNTYVVSSLPAAGVAGSTNAGTIIQIPPSGFSYIDVPTAAIHNYEVHISPLGVGTWQANFVVFRIDEIAT